MELILKYFPDLNQEQISKFKQLETLYGEWNSKINVISRSDQTNLYLHHVLHSLALSRGGWITQGQKVLDIGCGGGFPVIPLAILMPSVQFTAVDSIGKKIRVVQEVASALALSNVQAINCRAESLSGRWDWAISRAVAPLEMLLTWSSNLYERGLLTLKGGDLSDEIAVSNADCQQFNISEWFDEDFFSTKKVILVTKNLQNNKK